MTYDPGTERRRALHAGRERAAAKAPTTPPGLTAALIYLRPVPRMRVLSTLANLGVFVREYQALPVMELWSEASDCELAVVAAGNDPSHIAAVERLLHTVTPSVVTLVPDEAAAAAFEDSGIVRAVRDAEPDAALLSAFTQAAQLARQRRETVRTADTINVGEVRYAISQGRLEGKGRGVGLSGAEQKVLRRLTATPGVPVSSVELEGAVQDADEHTHGGELRATILRLRRKIEQVGGDPLKLGTVRGFGYVLVV